MAIRELTQKELKLIEGGVHHLVGYAPMERRLERAVIMRPSGGGGGSSFSTVVDLRR